MRREGREPLPDHAGESPLLSRSGGEKGLRGSDAGTLGVPLGGTRRVGGLLGVAGRLSGTVSPFRAEHDDGVDTTILFDKMDLINIRFAKETRTDGVKEVSYIVVYISYLEENSNKLFSFLLKKAEVTP